MRKASSSEISSWDEHYRREITNFEETGDEGEIWFGVAAEREMIKFLCGRFADVAARSNLSMVELGTGNGSLLRWLVSDLHKYFCRKNDTGWGAKQ